VDAVELNGDTVVPTFAGGAPVRADALVVRSGPRPVVPHCAVPRLGQQVLHSSDLMTYEVDHARRDVLGDRESGE
jgi:lysine/ornithine N-monooxygenase